MKGLAPIYTPEMSKSLRQNPISSKNFDTPSCRMSWELSPIPFEVEPS